MMLRVFVSVNNKNNINFVGLSTSCNYNFEML